MKVSLLSRRPLSKRINIVVSKSMTPTSNGITIVYNDIHEALKDPCCLNAHNKGSTIFVIGGVQMYESFIKDYMYLCNRIVLTRYNTDYDCDVTFPELPFKDYREELISSTRNFNRFAYYPPKDLKGRGFHNEYAYLDLLGKVYHQGTNIKNEKLGNYVRSIFGQKLSFDMSDRFPLLTTKTLNFDHIVKELLWMINGNTDTKMLDEQEIHTWTQRTCKKVLNDKELPWKEGDAGPSTGHQLRRWGVEYIGADGTKKDGQAIDYSTCR